MSRINQPRMVYKCVPFKKKINLSIEYLPKKKIKEKDSRTLKKKKKKQVDIAGQLTWQNMVLVNFEENGNSENIQKTQIHASNFKKLKKIKKNKNAMPRQRRRVM